MSWILSNTDFARTFLILAGILVLISAGCSLQRFNEDHAIGVMEMIRKSQEDFKSRNGHYGSLEELSRSYQGIPSSEKHGYEFKVRATPVSYVAVAVPLKWRDRSSSLYLDQTGIIRGMFKNGREADINDPPMMGYGINPQIDASAPRY